MSQDGPLTCKVMDYTLTFPPGVRDLKGIVVLQLPPGLKRASVDLVECLRSIGIDPVVEVDPTFGSCDLHVPQIRETLGDGATILHAGHTPYPPELSTQPSQRGTRVLYVNVTFDRPPSEGALARAAELLASRAVRRVSVLTTAQHVNVYDLVVRALGSHGLSVLRAGSYLPYLYEGQVLGCDYRAVPKAAEGYVMLGGGAFHALGLYLATLKPVVQVDPYRQEARDVTGDGERLLRVRLKRVSDAIDANRWGVITGLKTGQHRPWVTNAILASMRHHNKRYVMLASDLLTSTYLRDVDSDWFQAFVVTSCPRLPIDDLQDYEKPVLTPGEAFMALQGRLEPYIFPW